MGRSCPKAGEGQGLGGTVGELESDGLGVGVGVGVGFSLNDCPAARATNCANSFGSKFVVYANSCPLTMMRVFAANPIIFWMTSPSNISGMPLLFSSFMKAITCS